MKEITQQIYHKDELVSVSKFQFMTQFPRVCHMHQEVYKWSPEIYKEQLLIFEEVKKTLKDVGIDSIKVTYNKEDSKQKVRKYWELMGFNVVDLEVMGQAVMLGELEL